jgi:hypothetical protein
MLELMVDLDFSCCTCGCTMGVTLKCAGKGLAGGAHAVAAVEVACPTCDNNNHVCFEPSGMIHAVTPCQRKWRFPEPSLN